MGSEPGMEDMKKQIKREAHQFVHGYLKYVSPEVLYENRMNFTPAMVAERKRQQERYGLGIEKEPPAVATTAQLQKAMKKTWSSLYGFREQDDCPKKQLARDFTQLLKPEASLATKNRRQSHAARRGTIRASFQDPSLLGIGNASRPGSRAESGRPTATTEEHLQKLQEGLGIM